MNRKVSQNDPRVKNKAVGSDELSAGLTQMLAGLGDIKDLSARATQAVTGLERMNKRIQELQDSLEVSIARHQMTLDTLEQYVKDHTALHRSLDKENSAHFAQMGKLVTNSVKQATAVQGDMAKLVANSAKQVAAAEEASRKAMDALATASGKAVSSLAEESSKVISSLANREDSPIVVQMPDIPPAEQAVSIEMDRSPWKFDINRDARGLIDNVVASPKGK